jgi:hypothetical protein
VKEAPSTIPAPARLPGDLIETMSSPERASDPNEVNAALVRSALAAMSQRQDEFLKELSELIAKSNERTDALALEVKAVGSILSARIDELETHLAERLDTAAQEAKTIAHAVNEHTGQIRRVLVFATKTYDMSTSAARDTERVRKHLGIPDDRESERIQAAAQAGGSFDYEPESDGPAGPVR